MKIALGLFVWVLLGTEGAPKPDTPLIRYDLRIVEMKGQVFGLVVRSRGLGGNIMAGLRSLGGGEITEYTELLEDARRHAVDRMVQNATAMGANAVIRMQYDSSEIGTTMSEIVAYGTAAVVEPVKP